MKFLRDLQQSVSKTATLLLILAAQLRLNAPSYLGSKGLLASHASRVCHQRI